MKLTKTLMAAVAIATVSVPMTAQAQISPDSVIGYVSDVNGGGVTITRAGQMLRAQDQSAIVIGDIVSAADGSSAMVRLNGCNGKFTPCDQFVSGGNMVNVGTDNFCDNLAALMPYKGSSPVLSAGAPSVGGPAMGTALNGKFLIPLLVAAGGYGLYEILDDDEPASP